MRDALAVKILDRAHELREEPTAVRLGQSDGAEAEGVRLESAVRRILHCELRTRAADAHLLRSDNMRVRQPTGEPHFVREVHLMHPLQVAAG